MLEKVLSSIIEKGAYKTCIEYLIKSGLSEFDAIILVSELLSTNKKAS